MIAKPGSDGTTPWSSGDWVPQSLVDAYNRHAAKTLTALGPRPRQSRELESSGHAACFVAIALLGNGLRSVLWSSHATGDLRHKSVQALRWQTTRRGRPRAEPARRTRRVLRPFGSERRWQNDHDRDCRG